MLDAKLSIETSIFNVNGDSLPGPLIIGTFEKRAPELYWLGFNPVTLGLKMLLVLGFTSCTNLPAAKVVETLAIKHTNVNKILAMTVGSDFLKEEKTKLTILFISQSH